jgi:ABC-type bacteriocin/lantibiotic exporter with double-glycine peptidase domain
VVIDLSCQWWLLLYFLPHYTNNRRIVTLSIWDDIDTNVGFGSKIRSFLSRKYIMLIIDTFRYRFKLAIIITQLFLLWTPKYWLLLFWLWSRVVWWPVTNVSEELLRVEDGGNRLLRNFESYQSKRKHAEDRWQLNNHASQWTKLLLLKLTFTLLL